MNTYFLLNFMQDANKYKMQRIDFMSSQKNEKNNQKFQGPQVFLLLI